MKKTYCPPLQHASTGGLTAHVPVSCLPVAMAPQAVLFEIGIPDALARVMPSQLKLGAAAMGADEPASYPFGIAFLVGVVWLMCDWCLRRGLSRRFGDQLDEDGVPRWRCATGIFTQLLFLPCLFLLSLAGSRFSLAAWSETAGKALATREGERFYDWAFCYVFALYMLTDVLLLKHLSFLLKLHHVGCLLGLAIGLAVVPSGFPFFAAGVLSLELGSAAMNLWCLYPNRTDTFGLYFALMSASNLGGLACYVAWAPCCEYLATRVVGGAMSLIFTAIRQKTAIEALAKRVATRKRRVSERARSESPKSPMAFLAFRGRSRRDAAKAD